MCTHHMKASNHRLPLSCHPKQFGNWFKEGDFSDVPPNFHLDSEVIKKSFIGFYKSIQPDMRTRSIDWPLRQSVPSGESWGKAKKGGPEGIFSIMVLLGIWCFSIGYMDEHMQHARVAIADLLWMLDEMMENGRNGKWGSGLPVR